MKFKFTVVFPARFPGNSVMETEEYDLEGTREEVVSMARILDAFVPGQKVTIERVS